MPANKARKTGARNQRANAAATDRSGQIRQISDGSAQIVRDAAALLDEEMAAGILAAKQVQQRFQKERRINPEDFRKALEQFRGDAHQIISALDDQIANLTSKENAGLAKRLLRNTHGILDLATEAVNMAAELANQLAQSNLKRDKDSGDKPAR